MTPPTNTDLVLRAWLSGGAEHAAEADVLAVLERVAVAPQRRAPMIGSDGRWASVLRMALIGAAGALVLATGLLVATQVGIIQLPDPTAPSPLPTSSASPEASVTPAPSAPTSAPAPSPPSDGESTGATSIFDEAGFEIRLSDGWNLGNATVGDMSAVTPDGASVLAFAGSTGGFLEICPDPEGNVPCWSEEVDTLDQLAEVALFDPLTPDTTYVAVDEAPISIDGETALHVRLAIAPEPPGDVAHAFVATIHSGRPYLFRFRSGLPLDTGEIEQFFSGFHFLSADPVVFRSEEDGYEVLLPEWWVTTADAPAQTATAFGSGRGFGTQTLPGLTISVGDAEGWIDLCRLSCERVQVQSIADLEEAIESTPDVCPSPGCNADNEARGDLRLAGAPARFESSGARNGCLGCPGAYRHVFAIIQGRPIVLAFDDWIARWPPDWYARGSDFVDEIVESFRLTEPLTRPSGGSTHIADNGLWQIHLAEGWETVSQGGLSMLLHRDGWWITVRAADSTGRIQTCQTGAGPWEECSSFSPASLTELADGIGLRQFGLVSRGPLRSSLTVGGERAIDESVTSRAGEMFEALSVTYVALMHDDRPYLIRIQSPGHPIFATELLAGFEFLDE